MFMELAILFSSFGIGLGAFRHEKNKYRAKLQRLNRAKAGEEVRVPTAGEEEEKDIQEIRFKGRLYNVTSWIPKHPGGKVIRYYVNNDEDATEAITQFHERSASRIMAILRTLPSRPDSDINNNVVPDQKSVARNAELSKDFEKLFLDLKTEGYFEPSVHHVIIRVSELLFLAALAYTLIVTLSHSLPSVILGSVLLGVFQLRVGWFMHEAGHLSFTGKPRLDRTLQAIILGLGSGLSGSWWRTQHSRHHSMPQRLHHDNDIDTLPLGAVNVKCVDKSKNGVSLFIQNQAHLVVPVGATVGILSWKFYLHPSFVISRRLYLEMVMMASHYFLVYHIGLIPYMASCVFSASFLILNISVNHTHLPVTEEPKHWVEYAFAHTINVDGSLLCDWWMGYLNYQIEHHLFPTMPGFNHHRIQDRVKALAEKHGLPYISMSYYSAVMTVYNNLKSVSQVLTTVAHT